MFLGDWYFVFSSYLCTNFGTHSVLVFYIRFNVCASASCLRSLVVFRLWLIPIQETRQSFSAVLYTISTVLTSQRVRLYIKMRVTLHSHSFLVGVARLELAALRSRTVRATKLRYTPINIHAALASSVACLGARRACPLGLAFFTADLELFVSFGDFTCFVYALIANQTALHPD